MSGALRAVGLFAGIGGIELGLQEGGYEAVGLCEVDPVARVVLKERFSLSPSRLWRDVRVMKSLPPVDLLAAGFPCQDLSQAGRKSGISGSQSSLVEHVFRLMESRTVPHVLLENVSYMLRLDKGRAMSHLVAQFEQRGYSWAYRVVDARSFGIPQRRQRVVFLASRSDLDPSTVIHSDDAPEMPFDDSIGSPQPGCWYGFYWTEGLRGLGWTRDAVPTVKGGSGLGIPSPPAIWNPASGSVGTPSLRDAEALQGFPADWTIPAEWAGHKAGARWRLIGNAVCVPMSAWVGNRLIKQGEVVAETRKLKGHRWPPAARGGPGRPVEKVEVSARVFAQDYSLREFLTDDPVPLSLRATLGFLKRAEASNLRFADGFLESMRIHAARMRQRELAAAS